ncbi:PH domain-containing protein [Clostridium lundense]|uniref:PH domain-containing protein n=1 Tax=Clostridium lundense TaxID=319475 RepID=UPI000489F846|nr:PH domain-containing protein [Clostridium lundense]
MEKFKSIKGQGLPYIIGETILYNLFIILMVIVINSYEFSNLFKIAFIVINIYELHYIFMYISLEYNIADEYIQISSIFGLKKEKIFFKDIEGYSQSKGEIKGVKLYGHGKDHFALGKSIIDKIGTAKMYVTCNKNIIYLKTQDITYGISPIDGDKFINILNGKKIKQGSWNYSTNKNINLYKDKKFFIPLIVVAVIIIILTLHPFVLYLYNKLPEKMPLSFDANFNPVKIGTGKQFAFKQMTYGVLNMAILFCMYYASYFYAKYDKKSAYKFIYVSLASSLLFFIMQIKVLLNFQ